MANTTKKRMDENPKFTGISIPIPAEDIAKKEDLTNLEIKFDLKLENIQSEIKRIPLERKIDISNAFDEYKKENKHDREFFISAIVITIINIMASVVINYYSK